MKYVRGCHDPIDINRQEDAVMSLFVRWQPMDKSWEFEKEDRDCAGYFTAWTDPLNTHDHPGVRLPLDYACWFLSMDALCLAVQYELARNLKECPTGSEARHSSLFSSKVS